MPPSQWAFRRPFYRRYSAVLYHRFLKHDLKSASLYTSSMLRMFDKPPVWLVRLCFMIFRYHKTSKSQINRFISKVNQHASLKSFMYRFDYIMHLIHQGEIKEAQTILSGSITEKNYTTSPLFQGILALIEINTASQPDESFANALQNINSASNRLKTLFLRGQTCEVYVAKLIQITVRDSQSYNKCLKILYRYCNSEPDNPNPLKLLLVFLFNFCTNDGKKIAQVATKLGRLDPICPIARKAMEECFSKHWISPKIYCAYLTRVVDYEPQNPEIWQVLCKVVPQYLSESTDSGSNKSVAEALINAPETTTTTATTGSRTALETNTRVGFEKEPSTESESEQRNSVGDGFETDDSDSDQSGDVRWSQRQRPKKPPSSQQEPLSQTLSQILDDFDQNTNDGDEDGVGAKGGDVDGDNDLAENIERHSNDAQAQNSNQQEPAQLSDSDNPNATWHSDWWMQLHFDPVKLNRYAAGNSQDALFRTETAVRRCLMCKMAFACIVYGATNPFVLKARVLLKPS